MILIIITDVVYSKSLYFFISYLNEQKTIHASTVGQTVKNWTMKARNFLQQLYLLKTGQSDRQKCQYSERFELKIADWLYMLMSWLTSAGPDVTEAMLQVSSQDVFAPRAIGPGAEEGADPLLLTHPTGPGTWAPQPPLCPWTVPVRTAGPNTNLISIWEQIRNYIKLTWSRSSISV